MLCYKMQSSKSIAAMINSITGASYSESIVAYMSLHDACIVLKKIMQHLNAILYCLMS